LEAALGQPKPQYLLAIHYYLLSWMARGHPQSSDKRCWLARMPRLICH
jgi:hypothetical protein